MELNEREKRLIRDLLQEVNSAQRHLQASLNALAMYAKSRASAILGDPTTITQVGPVFYEGAGPVAERPPSTGRRKSRKEE